MSEMIVQVRNKMLRRIGGVNHFVSHNKDYTIQFQFDESWDNVRTKMAVFAYEDGEYGSEIFDGDTCNVPELPREGRILIGVKAGEDLSTELLCIPVCKSADDVITDEYDEPDPKIYEQILDIINNLWNGGTTVYPSPVKFLASPSAAKVGDLIRVKEVDENGDVTRTEGFDVGVELEKKIDAPQVAKVGEVLIVEEVDAEGKPKKWKTQTVETEPPDWNENDPTKPGYVKNRTHYDSRHAVELFNTTVENTSLPFIKVADADIDVTKIDRVKMNVQFPASDGSVRTIEFDSDGGEITQDDVNGDGSQIDTIIKKTTGNVTERYILPYFKTNEVADECTETTGIYTAGLYMLVEAEIIKGTFVGFGNAGELKTIDSKYIELPYIINSEENAKIDMNPPYKLIEGETYIAKYKQNYEDYEIELVAKYCESLGAIGVFSDDNLKTPNQNRFYVTDEEVYVNNSWKSFTNGAFMGLYRYGTKYSIPINAIENLSERLNQKEWSLLKTESLTSDVSTYTFDSPYNLKRVFITITSSGSEANSSNNYSWITVGGYTLTGTYNIATTANTTKYVLCYIELIGDLIFGIMSSGNELKRNTDINMGAVGTSSKIINKIRIYTTSGVIGANSTITIYGVRE